MGALRRILHLGIKDLISLRYDLVLMLFVVYAFTLDVITATDNAIEVRNASIAVVDQDRSQLSTRTTDAFLGPQFQKPVAIGIEEVDDALNSGRYTFVVEFPPDFQADLVKGRQPEAQVNVDATAVAQALPGSDYISEIIVDEAARFVDPGASARPPPVGLVARVRYNQNRDETWFLGVAELLLMITVLTMMLPAAALIREQEHGTIEHLLVMPLTPAEIMLAKIWGNALVVQLGALLCLVFIIEGYLGVPLTGSKPLFLLGTLVYQFAITAIGMALATLVRTVQQLVLVMLLVIVPMVFLSGVFTPIESIPPALGPLVAVSPLRYYVDVSMAVLFRGAGLDGVARELLIMAGIGLFLFLLAVLRFRTHFSLASR